MANPWMWVAIALYLLTGFLMMTACAAALNLPLAKMSPWDRVKFVFFSVIWVPIVLGAIALIGKELLEKSQSKGGES